MKRIWNIREHEDGKKIFLVGIQGAYDLNSPELKKIVWEKIEETARYLDDLNELRELILCQGK